VPRCVIGSSRGRCSCIAVIAAIASGKPEAPDRVSVLSANPTHPPSKSSVTCFLPSLPEANREARYPSQTRHHPIIRQAFMRQRLGLAPTELLKGNFGGFEVCVNIKRSRSWRLLAFLAVLSRFQIAAAPGAVDPKRHRELTTSGACASLWHVGRLVPVQDTTRRIQSSTSICSAERWARPGLPSVIRDGAAGFVLRVCCTSRQLSAPLPP
jgi:hypothetical protein